LLAHRLLEERVMNRSLLAVALALLLAGSAVAPGRACADETPAPAPSTKRPSHRTFRARELGLLTSLILCPFTAVGIATQTDRPEARRPRVKRASHVDVKRR
jgi:hypothetical protein